MPLIRNKDGTFKDLAWEEALQVAGKKLHSVKGEEIQGTIGQF